MRSCQRQHTLLWPIVAGTLCVTACGGADGRSTTAPGTTPTLSAPAASLVFRASPIEQSAIRWITPLGNLNPPDHALPTDHIYFYFADPDAGESATGRRTSFFAPADGVVESTFGGGASDTKVILLAAPTVHYYLDHLIPDVPLSRGTAITAGQRLGTTGSAFGVDLGVITDTLTLPFLNVSRYGSDTLHADAPLKYYQEPLRSQLYARVQTIGADRDGRIVDDIAGRLSGNWFIENGSAPLAFVHDTYDPSQVRISAAGSLSTGGVFAIAPGDPQPRDVSTASGSIRYTLTRAITGPPRGGSPAGTLLVRMLSDQRMQAEMFPLGESADAFTSAVHQFVR